VHDEGTVTMLSYLVTSVSYKCIILTACITKKGLNTQFVPCCCMHFVMSAGTCMFDLISEDGDDLGSYVKNLLSN